MLHSFLRRLPILGLAVFVLGAECDPPPKITITSPAHGDFSTNANVTVQGLIENIPLADAAVTINGVSVSVDPGGNFSASFPLDFAEVFNPFFARLTRISNGNTWNDRVVVIAGDSIADGAFSPQSVALRLRDAGLNQVEPLIESQAAAALDIQAFLLAANPVATTEVCVLPLPFGACGASVTVTVDVTSASYSGFALDVDSMSNFVTGDIDVTGLVVNYDTDGIDCQGRITSNTTTILGDYTLQPDAGNPSNIDVNQTPGSISVSFSGFSNQFTGGICDFPVIGDIIGLIIGNVEPLVRDGFEAGLEDPDGAGPGDAPIAEGIETVLADISITGPLGEALGVNLETPLFDVAEDNDGITLGSDARILQGAPPNCDTTGAPDLLASYHVPEAFPTFGPTTPELGQPYHMGLCLSTSAFNQLLKAEVECGLLQTTIFEIDLGTGPIPLTAGLLGSTLMPELNNLIAAGLLQLTTPMEIRIAPTLAPVVTGNTGPGGELAELRIGGLSAQVVEPGLGATYLGLALEARIGLAMGFSSGALTFSLSEPGPGDIDVTIVHNPGGSNEALLEFVLPQLISPLFPGLASSLGSLPIPSFLGLNLSGVEVSRQGEFMSLFTNLGP